MFLCEFEFGLEVHMLKCWRSKPLLHYIVGGYAMLAQEFAQMLVQHTENLGVDLSEEDNKDITLLPAYIFPDTSTITLTEHHDTPCGKIEINVRERMHYFTSGVNMDAVANDVSVEKHWHLIDRLACLGDDDLCPVQLFENTSNSKFMT